MAPKKPKKKAFFSVLFLIVSVLYEELLLKGCVGESAIFDRTLFYIVFFSAGAALLVWATANLLKARKLARWVVAVFLLILGVLSAVEYCVFFYYGTFFEFGYMLSMMKSVARDFGGEAVDTVVKSIWYIVLALLPFIVYLLTRKSQTPRKRYTARKTVSALIVGILFTLVPSVALRAKIGPCAADNPAYGSAYTVNSAIPRFGLLTNFRLEAQYALFGLPTERQEEFSWPDYEESDTDSDISRPSEEDYPPEHVLEDYQYNILDYLDFSAMDESLPGSSLRQLNQYIGTLAPTSQNRFTGMFEGKNLIVMCCEAFSPYAVDEELTPTLYRLMHEGFVFTNYYQPNWRQSTTGGEFSVLTGLVPTRVNGLTSLEATIGNDMSYSMAGLLKRNSYHTLAYHDHNYDYYSRDLTHPNLGYEYYGIGNGLVLERSTWPNSDLDMMKATADGYLSDYAENGRSFHVYYMTVSGHSNYTWVGNKISARNRDYVNSFSKYKGLTEMVKGYLATQVELDKAMEYLLEKLEAYGAAEDTVIVMTADHYPYYLKPELYQEIDPYHTTDTADLNLYRNAFICWSGSMEEPIVVEDPCSAIDIAPTLMNLFGIPYDSRLFAGRDVLDASYETADTASRQPLVVFPDNGKGYDWISVAGEYNASYGTFTPAPGYESYAENKEYQKAMSERAAAMFRTSQSIVALDYYRYLPDYQP